ncbi:MAG: ABC transporter permease, partial [Caldimonas sp.]
MSALAPALPGIADPLALRRSLGRSERVRKLRAFALTLPLLVFLMLTFLVPIAALLKRAIENPEVANALPRTVTALERWNRRDAPPDEAYAAVLADLGALPDSADAGALARRLNSEVPGARSLVMNAYKALPLEGDATPGQAKARMIALDERWADMKYWQAIAKNGSRWTGDYLLASVDLKRDAQGTIERMAP